MTTSNNPVRHFSRLDQRHWTHGYRRLTVCSVVRPSCWLWRTEDSHDDLLTQWQAYTVQSGTLEPCRADTENCCSHSEMNPFSNIQPVKVVMQYPW